MKALLARLRRPTLGATWPLLLLGASILLVALTAFQAQRAVRSQRRTAEGLLRDYGRFAAWSLQNTIEEELREAVVGVLGPILHEELHGPPMGYRGERLMPTARNLPLYYAETMRRCRCQPAWRPASYFAFTLGVDTLTEFGRPLDDRARSWVLDSLPPDIRNGLRGRTRAAIVSRGAGSGERLVAVGLMPTVWHDTVVYGMEMDSASVVATLQRAFTRRGLLPAAIMHGRPNASLLAVRVSTPAGTPLFESAAPSSWDFAAVDSTAPPAGGLVVQASVRPELASQLVIGGLPRSRLPLLLGMLAVAVALAVVAVRQLRREAELSRLRADFVSSVSHELRTPLTQIRLFVETLRLGRFTTDEQRRWSLENIDRETARLAHLVENVLHFHRVSRVGAAAALPEAQAADVGVLVRDAVRAFAPLAATRDAAIDARVEEGVEAMVRPDAFRQVLLNVLDNAAKYGPRGQTIVVSLARDGERVRLAVEDEGPGVPASERDAVFTPFFRGTHHQARAVGGSGIGLSVVTDVVRAHDGRAWVEPRPDGVLGARFVVELPALPPRAAAGGAAGGAAGDAPALRVVR